MRRMTILAAVIGFCVAAPVASADPGAGSAAARLGATVTTWSATYNAEAYYGAVKCAGKTKVSKKYPGGREVEICETTEGKLKHMKSGKEQKAFENNEGGSVAEWESDSGSGKRTTTYSYSVNKPLTKFKLIAIYAPPEV